MPHGPEYEPFARYVQALDNCPNTSGQLRVGALRVNTGKLVYAKVQRAIRNTGYGFRDSRYGSVLAQSIGNYDRLPGWYGRVYGYWDDATLDRLSAYCENMPSYPLRSQPLTEDERIVLGWTREIVFNTNRLSQDLTVRHIVVAAPGYAEAIGRYWQNTFAEVHDQVPYDWYRQQQEEAARIVEAKRQGTWVPEDAIDETAL